MALFKETTSTHFRNLNNSYEVLFSEIRNKNFHKTIHSSTLNNINNEAFTLTANQSIITHQEPVTALSLLAIVTVLTQD